MQYCTHNFDTTYESFVNYSTSNRFQGLFNLNGVFLGVVSHFQLSTRITFWGMIHELAPKATNRENLTIQCAAGAPPDVPAGTRRTHFTSNLEEYCLLFAILLARNVSAWHFRDVT